MENSKTKEYSNGEITVVWNPGKCIHSGNCVRGLPHVFKPKERPWINITGDTSSVLTGQVKKCPSGALSFYVNDNEKKEDVS